MSTKIYAKARFGFREDTLKNWIENNPILEKGEPAVISDSEDNRWLKIGDGKTPFNSLPWKATGGGMVDQSYNPTSENAQSGIAVAEALVGVEEAANIARGEAGEALEKVGVVESKIAPKTYELIATIKVAPDENGNLPTSIVFTKDSNGNPFELTDFCLSMVMGATDGSAARVALYVNDKMVFGNVAAGLNTSLRQWYMNYMNLGNGILCVAPNSSVASTYHAATGNSSVTTLSGNVLLPTFKGYNPVTKVRFTITVGTTKTFVEGGEIKLYGVRK